MYPNKGFSTIEDEFVKQNPVEEGTMIVEARKYLKDKRKKEKKSLFIIY